LQRLWKVSYARRLAAKRLCRATVAHSRMRIGRSYDISHILEMSSPWPTFSYRPPTKPLQHIPPTSQERIVSSMGGTQRREWIGIALFRIDNNQLRDELINIYAMSTVTTQIRRGLRLPYGNIRPEQVYAFAYHDKTLC
jgi:hypothetical protein